MTTVCNYEFIMIYVYNNNSFVFEFVIVIVFLSSYFLFPFLVYFHSHFYSVFFYSIFVVLSFLISLLRIVLFCHFMHCTILSELIMPAETDICNTKTVYYRICSKGRSQIFLVFDILTLFFVFLYFCSFVFVLLRSSD